MRLSTASWLLPVLLVAGHELEHEQPQFAIEQPTVYAAANSSIGNCDKACIAIQQILGQHNVYHGTPPEGYLQSYFSIQQQELQPVCVVVPQTAQQVASAITIVRDEQCPFSVRSGGHASHAGASNIQGGLVFDLRSLNGIELSEDKTIASIGPGNKWMDVYRALEEYKLCVAGGRVGTVGVGGFLLGGGLSLYSQKYGWAVDIVRNFEIVLSDGTIANVNVDTHPDLYWALRGGGGNFGIVTRFDLKTHPLDQFWAGTEVFAIADLAERQAALNLKEPAFDWTWHSTGNVMGRALRQALCLLGKCAHSKDIVNYFVGMAHQTDTNAHSYIWFAWAPEMRMLVAGGSKAYLEPVEEPAAFENVTALNTFYSTTKLRTVTDLLEELSEYAPSGYRSTWDTITFHVDAELISKLWDIFLEEMHEIKYIPGCQPAVNFQLITKNMIVQSAKNGGNPMGIKPEDGALFLLSITVTYVDAKDDARIKQVVQNSISRAKALGEETGLYHPFLYKNYADGATDVYAGYGAENRQKLRKIQKKYDTAAVFSRLQSASQKL